MAENDTHYNGPFDADTGMGCMNTGNGSMDARMGRNTGMDGMGNGMGGMNSGMGGMNNGMGNVNNGMDAMNNGMGGTNTGMGNMNNGMGSMNTGIGGMNSGMGNMNPSMGNMDSGMGNMDSGMRGMNNGMGSLNSGMGRNAGNGMDPDPDMDAGNGMDVPAAPPAAGAAQADGDYGLTTPLPEFGEGGPVAPGPGGVTGNGQTPSIPLPDIGAGGPVDPGYNPGGTPVIPLPMPGEGGPVAPGPGTGVFPGFPIFPNFPNISPQFYGQVRFLNASTNVFPVNISIDGTNYAINSRFGTITNYDWVADGFHTVTVRRASGLRSILLQQNFPFVAGQKVTMVLTDSASGGLEMVRIVDTGCRNMPFNSGCYRFANMTYSGSRFDLLLYGGETVFRNVGFQAVTAYKQAMAGTYQFYITNSNTYTFLRELPIIVIGAIGTNANIQQPLVSFQIDINAGQNYTTYLIGNTWSDNGLRAITVED